VPFDGFGVTLGTGVLVGSVGTGEARAMAACALGGVSVG
jgi:hypothetical protein